MSSSLLLLRPVQALRQITQILWSNPKHHSFEEKTEPTLPETNSSPLKIGRDLDPNGTILFQPSIFRCKQLVSRRVVELWWHASFSWEKNATGKHKKSHVSDYCSRGVDVSSLLTNWGPWGLLLASFIVPPINGTTYPTLLCHGDIMLPGHQTCIHPYTPRTKPLGDTMMGTS